nr:Os03g0718150 [Ipomoea batatas]
MIVELCLDFKNQIGINLESRAKDPIPNRQIRSENRIGDRRCPGVLAVERRNPDGALVFHVAHEMNDSRREHKYVALPKAPGEETVLRVRRHEPNHENPFHYTEHLGGGGVNVGRNAALSVGQYLRARNLVAESRSVGQYLRARNLVAESRSVGQYRHKRGQVRRGRRDGREKGKRRAKKEVQRCNSASGHTCWKVLREAKIDPPIQTLYFLSGGATTLIFILLGANAVISLLILSAMPVNIVVPPLRTIFPYSLGVKRSFCKEDWVLLWSHTEFIVESMMPYFLHVIPVVDNSMFNGVLQSQNTSLRLSLISNISILLAHANHHSGVTGASNNAGKHSSWSIISSESSLKISA